MNTDTFIEFGLILALFIGVILEGVKPLIKQKEKLPLFGLIIGGVFGALFSTHYSLQLVDGILVGVLASTFADSCYNILRPMLVRYVTERHLSKLETITKDEEEAKTLEEVRENDKN